MCGIIGVASKKGALRKPLGEVIREALKRLEYRGYDSVGFAIVDDRGNLFVRKSKGKIDDVQAKLAFSEFDGVSGVGHTRWATHGPPSDVNAHPHIDCLGRVAVAHNGIIENYAQIREWLLGRGHRFVSETDTEVIPHLIEEFKRGGARPYEAFKATVARLKGAFAIVAIDADAPGYVFFARNTSPLVLGFSGGVNFVASDIPAFLPYTNKVMVLRDWEVGYLTPDEIVVEELRPSEGGTEAHRVSLRIKVIDWTPQMAMKGGYPHYMIKEIHEQPQAIAATLAGLPDQIGAVAKALKHADKVVLIGAGTSYHASFLGALALTNIAGVLAVPVIASEARWYLRGVGEGDVVIAVSQSGETIDTLLAVREARKRGALTIAVSNVVDSAIPRESDMGIYTRAGPEIGVAATKTFTAQVVTLTYLAAMVGNDVNVIEALKEIPELAEAVIIESEPLARELAKVMAEKQSAFYLGRGPAYPVAMEGALKLKEVSYLHAEAYPAGESKHGPIALVEEGFPVVFTALSKEDGESLVSNIEEMAARGAWRIAIAPRTLEDVLGRADVRFPMPPTSSWAAAPLYVIPHQLLAYYTAVFRGYDPDKPRNLAKTVTVV